jgi:hypothetical protein
VGGFRREQGYYADWFTCRAMAFRYGFCIIPETLALCRSMPDSYSAKAPRKERRERLADMLRLIDSPEFADLREGFKSGTLSTLGILMFGMILVDPPKMEVSHVAVPISEISLACLQSDA